MTSPTEAGGLEEVVSPIASSSKEDPHAFISSCTSRRLTRSSCVEQKESEMSILDVQGSPVLKSRASKKAKSPAGPSSKVNYFKSFIFLCKLS